MQQERRRGIYFSCFFNMYGSITRLPEGSFDTSKITTAGFDFFFGFNAAGTLTSLPVGSFNIGNIATTGHAFFFGFNASGSLTSLPFGSFDTSNITTVGQEFFTEFNAYNGKLTQLPAGSFDTSNITTVGNYFFRDFNAYNGHLTKSNTGIPIKNISSGAIDFQSWNGTSSDTTTIAPGDTFEFYETNKWNYVINPDNGELIGGTPSGETDEGAQITLPTTATRAGYTFAGFTSSAWIDTKGLGETFTLTGDTEIAATWTKNADPTPDPTPNPDNGGQTPAAPNTGFGEK